MPTERRRWLLAATVLVAAFVLLFLFRWRHAEFDTQRFFHTLASMRWPWLALATAFILTTYLTRSLRWAVMLRPLKSRPNLWGVFSATTIGFTAIVLFGRPGELVRPYLISAKEKVPFSSQLAAWVVERIFDMLGVLVFFSYALYEASHASSSGSTLPRALQFGTVVAGVTALVTVAALILFRRAPDTLGERLLSALSFLPQPSHNRLRATVQAFADGMACLRDSQSLLALSFYSLVTWCLIWGCIYFTFKAMPALADLGLSHAAALLGFVAMGSMVQLPGVGGGVQLMAIVVLNELYHQPLEVAAGYALVIYALTFLAVIPLGLLLLVPEGLTLRRILQIEQVRREAL